MGLLDNYVNTLTDSNMGPYSLTDEDRKKLKKRGILQFGLSLLANPTGQGSVFQALGKGLLGGSNAVQEGGQDLMQQKFLSDKMERQKAEFEKQKQIDGLAAKHRLPDGTVNMDALRNEYMAIDPIKFISAEGNKVHSRERGANGNVWLVMADGSTKDTGVKFDPRLEYKTDSNNNPFAFNRTDNSMTPVGAQGQPQSMPFSQRMPEEQIIAQMNKMAQMKMPNDQIEAWGRAQLSMPALEQASFTNQPAGAASRFNARTPENIEGAKAGAAAEAKARVELETAPSIAAATKIATDTAEAQAKKIVNAPKVIANADALTGILDKAINHPGRQGATGASAGNPFNEFWGSDTRDFGVLMKQIKGKSFLEAFESLRGSGAITEKEGQAATEAIARLDTAQSEEEFLVALNELKKTVKLAKDAASRPVGAKPTDKSGWSIKAK